MYSSLTRSQAKLFLNNKKNVKLFLTDITIWSCKALIFPSMIKLTFHGESRIIGDLIICHNILMMIIMPL